ncbi:putative carboxypeptidase S1 [Annulohypoxylon maeteangense]|uniref:putative carboxypeptidase S1 n=1 Tax=Annulohypoxylon maeteangense TaxID=1927788 RepID=UPI0020080B5B|nr:putative carboxypeptidase S1 [Annulohypoxylon maeteangense]KAI0881425.1 putative carboxypeptidase S1 [Annulohypoxylon maeteangense]
MQWLLKFAAGALLAVSTVVATSDGTASPRTANRRYIEERNGVHYNVFEHVATRSKLSFVKNSGICETTPGVNQYSGYLTVGENMNMWFWFFEARENPQKAPLVAYLDGGPGAASEYGLFTQIGPCHFVNNETTPSLNPYAFNNYANMLYIDQPIGVGFSYGNETTTEYENRDFGVVTESYGGHYLPEFTRYILEQNDAVIRGDLQGEEIRMVGVAIHNGWFDAAIQEKSNIEYMYNNSYRQIINESFHDELLDKYNTTVKPALDLCHTSGTNANCFAAYTSYSNTIEFPILAVFREKSSNGYYLGDIREPYSRPPSTHVEYLQRSDIQRAIGAKANYTDQAGEIGFYYSGDDARSFIPQLSDIVQAGIKVLIWTGDADYVSNWYGTLDVAHAVEWSGKDEFATKTLEPYTLNGVEKGTFKSVDNFTFMRIYEAGHNVPFYQPEASLQIFRQFMETGNVNPT